MKKIKLSNCLMSIFSTPEDAGYWFGYYNYDTLNHDQTKLLCCRTLHDAELPQKGYIVEVGYFDLTTNVWHKVGESDSYSWPQGCMAQWLPGKGNENKIIYNSSNGKNNIAIIVDIKSHSSRILDWSIYGLTPDGKKSIALIMERSHWCRAYHYESVADHKYDGKVYVDDGIFEIDLENNVRRKIISIQDVIAVDKEEYFDKAKHWLEHIMISPNGKRFCFLHRFTVGDLNDYETRLFIADIDGGNLQCINGWREFYWSHFGWNGDNAFSIYTYETNIHNSVIAKVKSDAKKSESLDTNNSVKTANPIRILIKKIFYSIPQLARIAIMRNLKGVDTYYQYYENVNGYFQLKEDIDNFIFAIDGHPSFTSDGKYMITDTYPYENQYQKLIVYNIATKKSIVLGSFYAGLNKKAGTCDLHPKLCRNNDFLAVDSAHNGKHHTMLFKLNWNKIKQKID